MQIVFIILASVGVIALFSGIFIIAQKAEHMDTYPLGLMETKTEGVLILKKKFVFSGHKVLLIDTNRVIVDYFYTDYFYKDPGDVDYFVSEIRKWELKYESKVVWDENR